MADGRPVIPQGPFCVGIDLSTRAIDLVAIDENTARAQWSRIHLEGDGAFARCRQIAASMPLASYWDDVYLVAIERPFIRRGQDIVRLAQGAVLAGIPVHVPVWEVSVSQWKHHAGIPTRAKPARSTFPGVTFNRPVEHQDTYDALGVALYARDLNAAGVAKALQGAA